MSHIILQLLGELPNWITILIGFVVTWAIWVTIEVMKFKEVRHDMSELRRNVSQFLASEIEILKQLVKKDNGG